MAFFVIIEKLFIMNRGNIWYYRYIELVILLSSNINLTTEHMVCNIAMYFYGNVNIANNHDYFITICYMCHELACSMDIYIAESYSLHISVWCFTHY